MFRTFCRTLDAGFAHRLPLRVRLSLSALLLSLIILVGGGASAAAHQVATGTGNSTVSGVLQLTPNAQPVIGQKTMLSFFITDSAGHFSTTNCHCRLTVQRRGQILLNTLTSVTGGSLTTSYRFPSAGTYTISLVGTPVTGNAFHPFALTYQEVLKTPINWLLILLAVACFLVAGFILIAKLSAMFDSPSARRHKSTPQKPL